MTAIIQYSFPLLARDKADAMCLDHMLAPVVFSFKAGCAVGPCTHVLLLIRMSSGVQGSPMLEHLSVFCQVLNTESIGYVDGRSAAAPEDSDS